MSDPDDVYADGYDAGRESMQEELTRLRAEVETLKDSNAAKADRLDRLGETVVKMRAENAGHERVLTAMTKWLEKNQPDVWRRGIWDDIYAARAALGQEVKP